jgi:hypothetical protein
MVELMFLLCLAVLVGLAYLAYGIGVLLYPGFLWLISPILKGIEHRRILEEESQKEACIAHKEVRDLTLY